MPDKKLPGIPGDVAVTAAAVGLGFSNLAVQSKSSTEVLALPPKTPAGERANHDINVLQVITSGVSLLAIALVVMIFFSQTFEFGGHFLRYLLSSVRDHRYWRALAVLGAAVGGMLILYLLDFSYWKGHLGATMRRLATLAVIILFAIGGLLSIDDFPVLPLAIALLILPFAALFLRATLYRDNGSSEVRLIHTHAPLPSTHPHTSSLTHSLPLLPSTHYR